MKRLLLSFAMLLAIIGTVAAETKTPIELKGGHQDNATLEEACDVEPLAGSTMDKLFGATFTPKNDFTNLFQYKPLEVGDYEKIIVKFGEPVAGDYRINYNAGFFELKGLTEYEIVLDGSPIEDFTIFNWSGTREPITITEVYFWTSKTMVDRPKGKESWVNIINNGTVDENDDLESFPLTLKGNSSEDDGGANFRPEIEENGYEGRCLKIVSDQLEEKYNDNGDKAWTTWSTQFFLKFNEKLPEGAQVRISMMIKADSPASITLGAHGNPRSWVSGIDGRFEVDTDWQLFTWEATVPANYCTKDGGFGSFAMDLNQDFNSNTFYFDNVKVEKKVPLIGADFGSSAAQIIFPYPTNITDLVEAGGKNRLEIPKESATLTVNGTAAEVEYVEYDLNGSVYVFPTEDVIMDEDDKVIVTFVNPADEASHIVYTDDAHKDEAIETIDVEAEWNDKVSEVMPYSYGEPILVSANPENGSFNLSNTISEFTLTFDKPVDCAKLTAKIDNVKLTNTPADGFSKVVKLTRTGDPLPTGSLTIKLTQVWGEYTPEEFVNDNDFELSYGIGVTTLDGDDQPAVIYASNFTTEGDDANGAGWMLNADNGGLQPASSGSGCNIRHNQAGFAADLMYLCTRGTALGVGLYGTVEDHKLTLQAKNYHLTLDVCQWDKDDARKLRVQVLPEAAVNPEDGTLIDETAIIADEEKDITPKMASKEYVHFDITVAVKEAGNYVIRLLPTNNGTTGGWNDGCAIGNIKVEYVPNAAGVVQVRSLLAAMQQARAALENAEDEKYRGAAYDALNAKIQEYDGKETVMTAPSAFDNAVRELNAAAKAMNTHVTLCNDYYTLAQKAYDLSLSKAKFNATEVYQNLKAAVDKYCTVEGEGEEVEMTVVEKTDGEELTAAKDELSTVTTLAEGLLTEGESNTATKGYAALYERIRLGVKALTETLGVAEDDELIVAAKNTVGDNDDMSAALMKRLAVEVCGKVKDGAAEELFTEIENEDGNVVRSGVDMTVFIKNPNLYTVGVSQSTRGAVKNNPEESPAPGWNIQCEGGYDVSWSTGWGEYDGSEVIPVDATLTNWGCGYTISQTLEGLPAGVYTLKSGVMERVSYGGEHWSDGGELILFGLTSGIEEIEDGVFYSEEFGEETVGNQNFWEKDSKSVGDIEVVDGTLTIGVKTNSHTHLFLNQFSLEMTGIVSGHDYAADYQEIVNGVETAKTAKVRALEVYDLNGRRLTKAGKGLTIVKKVMSDGTVKTSKFVK